MLNQLYSPAKQIKKAVSLPSVRAGHVTPLPGTAPFRILISSFGPNITKLSSQWHEGASFDLITQIGLLRIEGITRDENISLQHYAINELGVEGLKELTALVDVYRMLSSGRDQTQNIEVTLKQILQRIKQGNHASDQDQQAHLLKTALYLSRASFIDISSKQKKSPPLLILKSITSDQRGNIWLSYCLGLETFKAIYSTQQLLYPLPTSHIIRFHSMKACYPLMLTFFIGNLLTQGSCSRYFTTLCIESGLFSYEQLLSGEKNRTRNTLRVISAFLQLEKDEFIHLGPHHDFDTIFAANYCEETAEQREKLYHPITLRRLEKYILTLRGLSKVELRTLRREALQRLLNIEASQEDRLEEFPEWGTRLTIHPGPQFLKNQEKILNSNKCY